MGKKQKQYDKMMATLQSWIDKASQPSQYELDMSADYNNARNWLNAKDYRNLPTGVNVDLLPLADYQRMQKFGQAGAAGTVAKGADGSQALQMQRDVANDELTRDWGQAYEQKVGGIMDRVSGLANNLQSLYSNRMGQAIQGNQAQIGNFLNRPQGFSWGSFLGNLGMNALPAAISAI